MCVPSAERTELSITAVDDLSAVVIHFMVAHGNAVVPAASMRGTARCLLIGTTHGVPSPLPFFG